MAGSVQSFMPEEAAFLNIVQHGVVGLHSDATFLEVRCNFLRHLQSPSHICQCILTYKRACTSTVGLPITLSCSAVVFGIHLKHANYH